MHQIFAAGLSRYVWLADQDFVQVDKGEISESDWGCCVEFVGPQFSVKLDDDPLGPIATIGSDAAGWFQIADVVWHVAPNALPDYPECFPVRETEAEAFRQNLQHVTAFFARPDLEALRAGIVQTRRGREEKRDRLRGEEIDVAAHFGFKKDSKEWRKFLSETDKALNLMGNAIERAIKPAEKKN